MPERIRLRRAKGWRKPDGAVTVARPSAWGNPFRLGEPVQTPDGATVTLDRPTMIALYRAWLAERPELVDRARAELAGCDLACWCPLEEDCHGDVLLRVAAGGEP